MTATWPREAPVDVSLHLPPGWADITPDDDAVTLGAGGVGETDRQLRRERDRLVGLEPELSAYCDVLDRQLQTSAERARETEAALAALGATVHEGELVLAVLTVHLVSGELRSAELMPAESLPAEALPAEAAVSDGGLGLDELEAAVRHDLGVTGTGQDVVRVQLPAGPALRVHTIEEEGDGRRDAVVEHLRYLLVPDRAAGTVLLGFSTPSLGVAEELLDTFDAIAARLRIRVPA